MTAILFGSIGTLADTSELQREAFNQAFAQHGLSWNWSQAEYQDLLSDSGGTNRIEAYAAAHGDDVDAEAIHATKSEIFQTLLAERGAQPREDVAATIAAARDAGAQVALVTTTSRENIDALAQALAPAVDIASLDLVLDVSDVAEAKPAPDVYALALDRLGADAGQAIAIEDNVGGVQSAHAAGVRVIAFPGENNASGDFSGADRVVDTLSAETISLASAAD